MILWTIQPEAVYDIVQSTGTYRANRELMWSYPDLREQYQWLAGQMRTRIGHAPEYVEFPIWAWYRHNNRHHPPDLRRVRWCCGNGGEKFVCMELDVPSEMVLLSDFDAWSIILLNALISDTEEEDKALEASYEQLSPDGKIAFRSRNWERAFNVEPFNNGWLCRGEWVQATFWEIKKEYIKSIRKFVTCKRKQSPADRTLQ